MQRLAKTNFKFLLMLIYLISPVDLIPELVFGVFGYADDFVVCASLLRAFCHMMKNK